MAEYIDREKLLSDIEKYHLSDGKFQHWVEIQPTAEVESVQHGHWISRPDCGVTVCSVCHRSVEEAVDYPRCMFCGAIMDEED